MLTDILRHRPAISVDGVVATMTAIDEGLSRRDGLWWFNHLYLRVTLAVRAAVAGTTFHDPAFLEELDVVFANLYFDAAAAGDINPARAPSAWRPLFEARHQAGIIPIQYALGGMNAHINRDLPAAVVATYARLGGAPTEGDPRHEDFERINGLLEQVEGLIKADFATGLLAVVDRAAGSVDDAVAMWNVRAARDAAWTNAEVLWTLRQTPRLRDAFFSRLDSFTGFAGRGLLLPTVARV